jgi:hypothetical protein
MIVKRTFTFRAEPMPESATATGIAGRLAAITNLLGAAPESYEVESVALGYYFTGSSPHTVDITVGEDTTTYAVALWGEYLVAEDDDTVHVYSKADFATKFPERTA